MDSLEHKSLVKRIADLERALAAVPGGIVHVGPAGRISIASEQACRFLGLGYDELTSSYTVDFAGKTYNEDGSPCPPEEYPVSLCLMTGEPQERRTIGVEQPGGSIRWALFTAIPQEFEDGRGAVVTFVDITERKAAEEEARAMQARLQVADRLATVGTLAAGVAHEINNPLTYVLGNLELAVASVDVDSEIAKALKQAYGGARRVAGIVKDLSRFSRARDSAAEPFEVRMAIEAAVSMAQAELRHRAVLKLVFEDVPPVMGQQDRAVQVFLNLLVNAAQSIEAGNVAGNEVRVRVERQLDHVVVNVEDTGCGMSPEVLRQAMNPFFTTKPIGAGTGLGMSISHEIIARMGGDLRVESSLGHGTRVTVSLPASSQPRVSVPQLAPSELQRGVHILVVDDERSILSFVQSVLRDQEVTLASNGEEGLRACQEHEYDVVLCDLMMPNMTGMELYEHVLSARPEQAERFIFMTGGAYTGRARRFVKEQGATVLHKPFEMAELRAALVRCFERFNAI